MKELNVLHQVGIQFPDRQHSLLFNRNKYFLLFKNYEIHQFQLVSESSGPLASLNLAVFGKSAFNPLLAPFGGIEMGEKVSSEDIAWFLAQVIRELSSLDLLNVRIVNYPEAYNYSKFKLLEKGFVSAGFTRSERDPDWVILLNEFDFTRTPINSDQLSFVFDEEFDLKEVFDFLKANREKQGYDFRLGFDDFYGFFTALPEEHAVFALKQGEKLLAIMTATLVSDKIMYAFPAAYDPEVVTLEQILFFYASLFELLKENEFEIFDCGTIFNNQDKLILNQLGAVKTYRNTYSIDF